MKNFARLARSAWPYRLRFLSSLGCAVMVAALGFANIGAVYPLLKILFYNQNCVVWLDEQIEAQKTARDVSQARLDVMDEVETLNENDPDKDNVRRTLRRRLDEAVVLETRAETSLNVQRKKLDEIGDGPLGKAKGPANQALAAPKHELAIASARREEIARASGTLVIEPNPAAFSHRRADLAEDHAKQVTYLGRYEWAKPWVDRWLPKDGFKTLLLLIAYVMGGMVIKGLFQFLQDVLVADITQLCLFDIRNKFFRRTMGLDLSAFSDQGSAELMARFTNDMDSVAQGFNTVLSEARSASPCGSCSFLAGAILVQLAIDVPGPDPGPRLGLLHDARAGKLLKRAMRRSLESMSQHLQDPPGELPGDQGRQGVHQRKIRAPAVLPGDQGPLQEERPKVAKIDALSDPVLEILALTTVIIAAPGRVRSWCSEEDHVPWTWACSRSSSRPSRWRSRTS